MPTYSGKFQYRDQAGAPQMMGPCQLLFDGENCTITPASGAPLSFDLGDVERVVPGELDVQLTLHTGHVVQLRQFGALFSQMADQLLAAWRDRTVRCMLLEDLEEVMRCPGAAALGTAPAGRAEIRLYRTNLAVLPAGGEAFQWRLAEVDTVTFEEADYSIVLKSGASRLVLSKLSRKNDELLEKLRAALNTLRAQSATALHDVFPFLDPGPLQRLLTVMPEGRSVRLASLAAVHPKIPGALLQHAVDRRLKPYFDALRARAVDDALMAGFKFIRKEEAEAPAETGEAAEGGDPSASGVPDEMPQESGAEAEEKPSLFFWFFFPLADRAGGYANVAAWEACTGSGRATYFFRILPPGQAGALADSGRAAPLVQTALERITRGLALVNFRREPVYLTDEALERQPRFHRYAIGCRKLPDLRHLRAAMLGRAVHGSLEQWTAQVDGIAGRRGLQ